MKFLGWESASISIFLGSAIIFELFRLYFAYLHDKYVKTRSFLAFGLTCALLGLLLIPSALLPIGNLLLVIVGGLFYTGSSIISTLIDAHLTAVTLPIQRNRVAGILQTCRLAGFAIGGVGGKFLYANLEFTAFLFIVSISLLTTTLISIMFVKELDRKIVPNKVETTSAAFLQS